MKQTIYKKDSKGKLRYLTISTSLDEITQESGIVGGNPVINVSVCVGKNIGKTNATTAEEQAVIEAQAKIKKKLEEGYYLTSAEAMVETLTQPMLAKDFKEESKKVIYPCYVQPKLDGMRCLKEQSTLTSRGNKAIETMAHISSEVTHIADILDGELYAHGLSFQENMKLIKKYRKGQSEQVKYHVYDMILNKPFIERYTILSAIVNYCEHIELVPTYKINNLQELLKYHTQFIEQGYEGTMVRWGSDGYEASKRSSHLLKYKDFLDETYTIVDIVPSESRPTQGVIHCKGVDNSRHEITFGCGMRFSHQERKELLTNKSKYIGKTAEIRFFEFTDDGLPRFPVCVGIRLDK